MAARTVSRESVLEFVRSLGLTYCKSLEFSHEGVTAFCYAQNEDGDRYLIRDSDGPVGAAMVKVQIAFDEE